MEMSEARSKYADIIDREHHESERHPRMDKLSRAAQFSPFAALTGYDDMIRESERETDRKPELDEDSRELLNRRLLQLLRQLPSPEAAFTCFVQDDKKSGGETVTINGRAVKYDASADIIMLDSGKSIIVSDLLHIESDALQDALW